ncbi:MAG: hypothetical protein SGPRY_001131 [Prymnesium sp.]
MWASSRSSLMGVAATTPMAQAMDGEDGADDGAARARRARSVSQLPSRRKSRSWTEGLPTDIFKLHSVHIQPVQEAARCGEGVHLPARSSSFSEASSIIESAEAAENDDYPAVALPTAQRAPGAHNFRDMLVLHSGQEGGNIPGALDLLQQLCLARARASSKMHAALLDVDSNSGLTSFSAWF